MKLRKRTWALLLVGLLLVGGTGAYFGGREILKHRIKGWRAQGIAASEAGKHTEASELLVRYLQRRPEDIEALSYYVRSREAAELPNGQHLAETLEALKIILSLDPDRVEDRLHLLDLYARLGRRPEAIDTADALLNQAKEERHAHRLKDEALHALRVKTEVLIQMGRWRDALETAESWVKAAPDDLHAYMARISARMSQARGGDSNLAGAEGNRVLAEAVKAQGDKVVAETIALREEHPGDVKFELLEGFALAEADRADRAAGCLKAVAARPDLPDDVAEILVAQLDRLGMAEDALRVLRGRVDRGAGPAIRQALGERLWELGRWQEAADALAPFAPADPGTSPTVTALKAMSLFGAGHKKEAEAARATLTGRDQAAARAWHLILDREVNAAVTDDKRIVAECQAALLADPASEHLAYYYGEAQARLGELELAIDVWRNIAMQNPAWTMPGVRLVEALLQKGRVEEAFAFAAAAARRSPTQAATIITLARAWAAGVERGSVAQSDDLLKLVTEVQAQLPSDDQTLAIRVQLLGQRGEKEEAAKTVRAALKRTPPPGEQLLLNLAGTSRRYQLGVEGECLAASEELHGLTPSLAFGAAVGHLIAGDAGAGRRQFDEMAARSGKAADPIWKLARARYLDVSGDADASKAWVALGDEHPENLAIQQSAAGARAVRGDWEFQTRTIERLKALTGVKALAWRLAQGRLFVEASRSTADVEKGSLLLTDLLREYPAVADVRVLLARALERLGRTDGAIEHLTVAAEMDPASVPTALQLAALLQSRGDHQRAMQQLDRVAPQLRSAPERRQAAALLTRQGQDERAIEILKGTNSAGGTGGTQGADEDLMLAVLYAQRGQVAEAEAVAQRLLEKPDLPTVQFAASLYASQGRRADAEGVLTKLESIRAEPGLKEMARGTTYAQLGDSAEAEKHYEAATAAAPENPQTWRQLAMCHAILGRQDDLVETLSAAARSLPADGELATLRSEADLLRESIADGGLRHVVVGLIRNPREAAAGIDLLRVAAEGRRSGDREKYAASLQQLIERQPTFVPARLQLIDCYQAMGRSNEALSAAKQAMTAIPQSPEPARAAVALCVATGRWGELREAAEAWKKRAPSAAADVDSALAAADVATNENSAAISRLGPYLATAKAAPDNRPDVLTLYATATFNAGRDAEAVELLEPLVRRSPVWRVRGIQVALQVLDASRAAAWLDRLAAAVPVDAAVERTMLGEAYERLGRRDGADPKLVGKGVAMVREQAAKPDAPGMTLLAAGAQAERSSEAAAATEFYGRAVKAEPNAWVAHNNLAMLLAGDGRQLEKALEHAASAVRLQPTVPAVHDTLAHVQAERGDFKAAAASMAQAVRLAPDDLKWRVRLAHYLVKGGDLAGAANELAAIDSRRLTTRGLPPDVRKDLDQQLAAVREQVRQAGAPSMSSVTN